MTVGRTASPGPEVRGLALGAHLHPTVRTELGAEGGRSRALAQGVGAERPAGRGPQQHRAVGPHADAAAGLAGDHQLGRTDGLVGQHRRDPYAVAAREPEHGARAPARAAPRTWPRARRRRRSAPRPRGRSAAGRKAANVAGSTAIVSSGIRYPPRGRSTSSPGDIPRAGEPGVVLGDRRDPSGPLEGSDRVVEARRQTPRHPDEERLRRRAAAGCTSAPCGPPALGVAPPCSETVTTRRARARRSPPPPGARALRARLHSAHGDHRR